MRRILFALLLTFPALLSCGGGGSGPAPTPPPPPTVAVSISPTTASLAPGATQAFSATVTGSANTAVTWSVAEPGGGSVTAAGLYTAPAGSGTYHVRATAVADPTKSAEATVTVTVAPPPVTVTISPATASLVPGATQAFTATVTGSANTAVAWSVVEPGGGSVTSGGLYTAPAAAGTYHVRATAAADPTKSAEATVSVAAPGVVRIVLLHHSTGGVIWNGGLPQWFQAFNAAHGTTYQITERAYPDTPYPWDNYPYDYWNLWVNPAGPANAAQPGVHPLATLAANYDVIVFKHCFPVGDIDADTGAPDVASASRRAENYKLQYAALKARLRQFPTTRFVLWTGAARIQAETTPAQAQRARDFFAWVKTQWDEPGDNIFLWDFHELETEGGLYLKDAYAAGDSHPGAAFAQRVAPYLGQRLVNVIQGRGDSSRLDGNDAGPPPPPAIASFTATPATINPGQSSTLAWSVSGATALRIDPLPGTVSGGSTSVSPAATTTYTLTASNAGGSVSASATVTVTPPAPIRVSVSPATVSLLPGATQAFTATVTGSPNTAVTWSVVEGGGGSVSGGGLYTAPASPGTFHVRATSVADPAQHADAAVTVQAPSGPCNGADLGAGASLRGYRPFPADNPWNQDISGAPVDPASDAIIAFIGASRGLHPDFGAGLWDGGPIGIPYVVVGGHPKVAVHFTAYGDESDPGPMPIPSSAPVEGGNAATGDRHILVMDRESCVLYELYRAFPQSDGSWNADSAAVWDLKSNALRPFGWTSADAAGLPIFPGLARYDEVAAGEIPHALRFTVPTTRRAYVLPATHWASSNTGATSPPMGMRVRLKAGVDLSGFPSQAQVVLRALKKYGMILADNGSAWYISGAPDERWINDQLATLSQIKGSDLEVVQMGTVHTADPTGPPPAIASFTASPATIAPGGSATLSWSASNATRFFITPEVGWASASPLTVRPGTSTTYTLTAEGPYGSSTATLTVTVSGGGVIPPDDPGTADLALAVRTQDERKAISPWIYGINFYPKVTGAPPNLTLSREGGNRWTAYNWENNASNSGTDWGPYSNDGYLGGGNTPGEAVRSAIAAGRAGGYALLMTVPMQGYVAADKGGLVNLGDPNYLSQRFRQLVYRKGAAFAASPDTGDAFVYADESMAFLKGKFPADLFSSASTPLFVSLDNEPELWNDTHHDIQPSRPTPDAYLQKTVDLTRAIKDVAPDALTFGPVHYGFNGIYNWQGAPGFSDTFWFTDKYLQGMKSASDAAGRRLLDVYDFHWYSEAKGDGTRVINLTGATLSANQVQAIVQSPRSLWDPAYTEDSWITQWVTNGPLDLLHRLQAKIDANNPGTKLAITEYGNGGDHHIAGAIAQADNLGAFGRFGVFAATLWPLGDCPFILAGFQMYRNYDGARGVFGDTSVAATCSDWGRASLWASVLQGRDDRVLLVLCNKGAASQTAGLRLYHTRRLQTAEVYLLAGTDPMPHRQADLVLGLVNAARLTLPALSVTTLVLKP